MSKGFLDPRIQAYVTDQNELRESAPLRAIRKKTEPHPRAEMLVPVEQGRLLALLALSVGAKRALEVGVFTGYSSLSVAEVLPKDGQLIACDITEEFPAIGRPHWEEAGVSDRIDLRVGPAEQTLQSLIDAGEAGRFDFAFIDADKTPYGRYYDLCLKLLRPGGLVAVDNIFMNGTAIEPAPDQKGAQAIFELTARAMTDDQVDAALVPIADGLLVARKR